MKKKLPPGAKEARHRFDASLPGEPIPITAEEIRHWWLRHRSNTTVGPELLTTLEEEFQKAKTEIGSNEHFSDLICDIESSLGAANSHLNALYGAEHTLLLAACEAINNSIAAALGFLALRVVLDAPKSPGARPAVIPGSETRAWDLIGAQYARNPQLSVAQVYRATVACFDRENPNYKGKFPKALAWATVKRYFKQRIKGH